MDAVQRLRLAEINLAALEFAADTVERALEILRADQGFEPDSSRASTCAPVRASACARDDHPSDDKKIRKDDPRDWLDTTVYQIDDHPEAERIEQAIAAMRPELDARDRAAVWRDFARLNDRKRVSLGLEPKRWHISLLRGFAKTWRDLLGNFQKGLRAAYAERKEAEKREVQRLAAERKAEVEREARAKAEQKKPTAATSKLTAEESIKRSRIIALVEPWYINRLAEAYIAKRSGEALERKLKEVIDQYPDLALREQHRLCLGMAIEEGIIEPID